MKKIVSFLLGLLPHITLILSLMLLTFFVIDQFNEAMAFLDNTITKWLLGITSLLTVILSVLAILRQPKQ
ncbi:MAG: hypothetical protein IKJ74_03230 [Clostridia bacterium]|nr:hypothetical protein [Clostridia bacterium]